MLFLLFFYDSFCLRFFQKEKRKLEEGEQDENAWEEPPRKKMRWIVDDLYKEMKREGIIVDELKTHLASSDNLPPQPSLWKVFDRNQIFEEFKSQVKRIAVEIVRKNKTRTNFPVLAIRGRPGSGKTTALRWLFSRIIRRTVDKPILPKTVQAVDVQDNTSNQDEINVTTINIEHLEKHFDNVYPFFIDYNGNASLNRDSQNPRQMLAIRMLFRITTYGSVDEFADWMIKKGYFENITPNAALRVILMAVNGGNSRSKSVVLLMLDEVAKLRDKQVIMEIMDGVLSVNGMNIYATVGNCWVISLATSLWDNTMQQALIESQPDAQQIELCLLSFASSKKIVETLLIGWFKESKAEIMKRDDKEKSLQSISYEEEFFRKAVTSYLQDRDCYRLLLQINGYPRAFEYLRHFLYKDSDSKSMCYRLLVNGTFSTYTTRILDYLKQTMMTKLMGEIIYPDNLVLALLKNRGFVRSMNDTVADGYTWLDLVKSSFVKARAFTPPLLTPLLWSDQSLTNIVTNGVIRDYIRRMIGFDVFSDSDKGIEFENLFSYCVCALSYFFNGEESDFVDHFFPDAKEHSEGRFSDDLKDLKIKYQCMIIYETEGFRVLDDKKETVAKMKTHYVKPRRDKNEGGLDAIYSLKLQENNKFPNKKWLRLIVQCKNRDEQWSANYVKKEFEKIEKYFTKNEIAQDDECVDVFVLCGTFAITQTKIDEYKAIINENDAKRVLLDGGKLMRFLLSFALPCFYANPGFTIATKKSTSPSVAIL